MDSDELARRIGAGLRLRGITQADLGERFKSDGLGREDPGRIQRGELGMQRVHLDAFARHLELPPEWFTTEDFDAWLLSRPSSAGVGQSAQAGFEAAEALAEMAEAQVLLERAQGRLQRSFPPPESTGNG